MKGEVDMIEPEISGGALGWYAVAPQEVIVLDRTVNEGRAMLILTLQDRGRAGKHDHTINGQY